MLLLILEILYSLIGFLWYCSTDSFLSPCYQHKKNLLCKSYMYFPPSCFSSIFFGECRYFILNTILHTIICPYWP